MSFYGRPVGQTGIDKTPEEFTPLAWGLPVPPKGVGVGGY